MFSCIVTSMNEYDSEDFIQSNQKLPLFTPSNVQFLFGALLEEIK